MIDSTNDVLAAMFHRRGVMPEPGTYNAPCATAVWDGRVLQLTGTGVPLDDLTAAQWPQFAQFLTTRRPLGPPTVAALVADYSTATDVLPGVAPQNVFTARLAACRACTLWDEAARSGCGSCASVSAACSCRRQWQASDTCPEGKWPSNEV